jgi:uncharacterized protein
MIERTTFRNGANRLAAHLHLPPGFDPTSTYAALVCVHPGSGVKEQTAGLYAARMAERGYVALAYDAAFQGESEGEPRHLEDPATRVEDIRCAVDHLTTLASVDPERIGVLGVCAGGGYAANAAMTEHRFKAVGVVSPSNIGRATRVGDTTSGAALRALEAVGRQRTRAARGEEPPLVVPWTPASRQAAEAAGVTEPDMLEAIDYYRTPRGGHERSDNQLLFRSQAAMIAFDAFHLAEYLLTQPLQVVVGDRVGAFGAYRDGHTLHEKAASRDKRLLVVAGAGHYDLYDRAPYVDQAVEALASLYDEHLAAA